MFEFNYLVKAKEWYNRALKEDDEFIKFILLFITFEVVCKINYPKIRSIKHDEFTKRKFFNKIDNKILSQLIEVLRNKPHLNMRNNKPE